MNFIHRLLFIVSFSLLSFCVQATHIVGGYLSYEYIGGTQYRITLKVYRDCTSQTDFDGAPGSQVSQATVGLFEVTSSGGYVLENTFGLFNPVVTNLTNAVANPCLVVPSGVCVEQGVYTDVINVGDLNKRYVLVYERCCRNGSISNLNAPGSQGAVYSAEIPPTNSYHNSSPTFNLFPPPFICVNTPLLFNHSATDIDGDSLVYSLCEPFNGADQSNPSPNPPNTPPYPIVNFASPYSSTDPLGGIPIEIDATTGLLTGTPNSLGQYVVGICVSEYRNGVLLGTYLRDFQFNVSNCNIPVAAPVYIAGSYDPTKGYGIYTNNCSDKTVNFNNISYSNPGSTSIPLTYHWDFGVPTITDDTSNLSKPIYTYPDTGSYIVTIVVTKELNGVGCSDTAYALVRIYPTLTVNFMSSAAEICQDSAFSFTDLSVSTSSPMSSWSWNFGDTRSSTLQNPQHYYSTPGTYTVTLTGKNRVNCSQTITKQITVLPQPTANFTATSAVCVFTPITLTSTSTGTPAITNYDWNFGNSQTSNLSSPDSVVYTTSGTKNVQLIVTNSRGCKDTITKPIVVNPLPTVAISPNTIICPFTSTTLNASGGSLYAWSPGSTLSDSSLSNPVASPVVATTYTVTVTDANGCKNRDSVRVNLYPIPNVDAGLDTSVCFSAGSFRDSVRLQATGAVSFVWTPATGLTSTTISNPVSRPPTNTTYYVTGTDINGCRMTDSMTVFVLDPNLDLIVEKSKAICERDTTTLNVLLQGASLYSWTPNIGISSTTSNSPLFYPQDTTTYIFSVQNYCYIKKDTVTIIVHPLPSVGTQKIDSVCYGDTIQLHAQGANTYVWVKDSTLSDTSQANPLAYPLVTNTYYVTGTDTFGCRNSDSIKVLVYLPPVTAVFPDVPFICQGSPIGLNATGGVKYLWSANSSLSNLNIPNPIATPLDTTTYYVKITNIHNCSADDSITINVQLPVTAHTESPYDFCEGGEVQLHAWGGFYYHWTPGTWLSNVDVATPIARPQSSITYNVKVSNDCFTDSADVILTIRPLPIVDAGLDTTIFRNTPATLSGTTNGVKYYWYPGETVKDPFELTSIANPIQDSWYKLYAISEYDCINFDSVFVKIDPYSVLLLPTAFSPNGDGVNDIFRITKHFNIKTLVGFGVYNRWGERIFFTENFSEGWNGTYKNVPQELGVYVWYVKAITYDGETINKSGNVTLLR